MVKCNRSCPNGKVQLLHLVKVARVVSGEKTKAEMWPQELKVNIPSGYDNANLIWILVLTGLTRLLQIETDFMNGRATFLHYYY